MILFTKNTTYIDDGLREGKHVASKFYTFVHSILHTRATQMTDLVNDAFVDAYMEGVKGVHYKDNRIDIG